MLCPSLTYPVYRLVNLEYHRYTLHEFLHKRLHYTEVRHKYESAHSLAFPKNYLRPFLVTYLDQRHTSLLGRAHLRRIIAENRLGLE